MNSKIKYVVVLCVIVLITLEFIVFPSLSAQIKSGRFIYPQLIETEKDKIFNSIKVNENVLAGTWMDESGTQYLFKRDGTGTVSGYNIWVETTTTLPFTYDYDEKTVTITRISLINGDLIVSKIGYEVDGNVLKMIDGESEKYFIRA